MNKKHAILLGFVAIAGTGPMLGHYGVSAESIWTMLYGGVGLAVMFMIRTTDPHHVKM